MKLFFCDNLCKEIIRDRFKSFIVLGCITIFFCVIFLRGTQYGVLAGENYEQVSVADCLSYVKGYETEDYKSFKVIDGDPQLLLDFTKLRNDGTKVKCVLLELEQEIQMSAVHVYYGRDTTELSEQDSEGLTGESGKEIEICSMKSINGFKYLRLDVDQDFSIESMKVAYDYKLEWNAHILGLVVSIVLGIGFAVYCTVNNTLHGMYVSFLKRIKECAWENIFSILKILFLVLVLFCIVLFFQYCINNGEGYLNPYIAMIVSVIFAIIVGSIVYNDLIWENAHRYYFVVCMIVGTITIVTLPATVGISADDEIHYSYVENLSWGAKDKVVAAAASVYSDFIQNGEMYSYEARCAWEEYLNQLDEKLPVMESVPAEVAGGRNITITSVAYIPGAIGLVIGRGIGLSYTSTFRLGKWMNLLCYVALFSFAIKMTKGRGKTLISVIGLIPTNFFMACAYSYDWWVTSFIVFGYALFIKEISEDKVISIKRQLLIMAVMVIGSLPKAVYFPLILPMLFIRKEKLQDSSMKQRLIVLATMMFLVGTFVIPMLTGSAGTGDARGGADVNSIEQIKFILANPVQYIKILLRFLKSYLSPDNSFLYLTYFLYYGQAQYFTICLIVIAVVAMVDNAAGCPDLEYSMPKHTWIMAGSSFVTIVLVATALYISFTAVGRDTVVGCQPRYILPVLFPFLYFNIGLKVKLEDSVKRNLFVVSTSVMMVVYLYGIYLLRVKYF